MASMWEKAEIPIIARKIILLFQRYTTAMKNRFRKSQKQNLLVEALKNDLKTLFDIAHVNDTNTLITSNVVKRFLGDQQFEKNAFL